MEIKKILVTGDDRFIKRYHSLFEAISQDVNQLDYLPFSELYEDSLTEPFIQFFYKVIYKFSLSTADRIFQKNSRIFIDKSKRLEAKIRKLEDKPDLLIHIFSMCSPFWDKFDTPFVMYLDYTMALAVRNWSPWAPFRNDKEREAWIDCERQTYKRAYHLFTMNTLAKSSLIEDYGIAPEKITVVGSAGNFKMPYEGEKTFGSQQILFNGSDFERKGGNLVLAAFKRVKQVFPKAKLVIIGKKLRIQEEGIANPGSISRSSEIRDLLLETDLVVAPSYCDPFPAFLLEAMNYGVPCLVANNDGMPEIVDHEINGLVIHQMEPDILAEQIIQILGDPSRLESMSKEARKKVGNNFKWDKIASQILKTLSSSPQ